MSTRSLLLLLGLGTACDDTLFPSLAGGVDDAAGEGWCGVQSLIATRCVVCHSAGAAVGGLDLETNPHGTLLEVVSSAYGEALVVAGDPGGSLLVQKLRGQEGFGGVMPPSGYVGDELVELVEQWITDGADDVCASGPAAGERHHPQGWADPGEHGLGAKLQEEDCLTCHGDDLGGGTVGIACSDCHDAVVDDWTTTCTFCHGDPVDGTGAPPQDIDDNDKPDTITFPAHRLHIASDLHAAWTCEQCHTTPTSAFSPGHVLVGDTTAGRAELDFSGGLAAGGWASDASCTVYCHGPSRGAGTVERRASVTCGSCHAIQSTRGEWDTLSEPHEEHLDEDIHCAACHPNVDEAGALTDALPHVDGRKTLDIQGLEQRADGRCTGTCHGETHAARAWVD